MLDLKKTLAIVRGGLLEPVATWQAYREENHDWKATVTLVAGPLIVGSSIVSAVLSLIFRGHTVLGQRIGILGLILGILGAAISFLVAAYVFSYFAGIFKGRHEFDRGAGALALAAIPAWVGGALGPLPLIGWLVALAAAILSLVFLYRIIPGFLEVPEDQRPPHYAASLVVTIIVVVLVNVVFGFGAM